MSISLSMTLLLDFEQEDDGRWIVEIPDLPGVLAYGNTKREAIIAAKALALRTLADRVEQKEDYYHLSSIAFSVGRRLPSL
jgi:predicted RNase H-like HicB family nuclease